MDVRVTPESGRQLARVLERPPIEATSGIAQDDELAHDRQPGVLSAHWQNHHFDFPYFHKIVICAAVDQAPIRLLSENRD